MLKNHLTLFSLPRLYVFLILFLSFILLFQVVSHQSVHAAAYESDQSDANLALLGTIIELQEEAFLVRQLQLDIDSDADGSTQGVDADHVVSIAVTAATVYDRLDGFAELALGDSVVVAGVMQQSVNTHATELVAAYIVPLIEMSISEDMESEADQVVASANSQMSKSGSQVAIASAAPDRPHIPLNFHGSRRIDSGSWGFGSKKILDLGELGSISVGINLGRLVSYQYDHPTMLHYHMPKLVVGEPATIAFDVATSAEAFPGTYALTYTFSAKVSFSLMVLGKTYHLLDSQVVDTLKLDNTQTATIFNSATKRIPVLGRTYSIAVPNTDVAFKFSFQTDTLFEVGMPSMEDMPTSSSAHLTDDQGSTVKKQRQFASTRWKITPTDTLGTITLPRIIYGPSINQVTIKLRTELTGPIPIPTALFASHTISLGGMGGSVRDVGIPFTAAPALYMTESLPGGLIGQSYTANINASGGYAPYHYAVTSGSLPTGLRLDPATGIIHGIPNESNTNDSFTITMTDAEGYSKSQIYTVPVLHLTSDGVAVGQTIHQPFTFSLGAEGGVGPYHWQLVEGSLPPGITMQADTGLITGTPTEAGTYALKFKVTDSTRQATGNLHSNIEGTSELTMLIVPVSANGHYIWQPGVNYDLDAGPGNGMIYNPNTGETMQFTSRGETVVLRDGAWQKLEISGPAPLPRDDASLAYSPNLGGVILFGGQKNAFTPNRPAPYNNTMMFADTWLWDGQAWTELHQGVYWIVDYNGGDPIYTLSGDDGPAERYHPAMSQDPDGNIILYGGHPGHVDLFGDTWILKLVDGDARWIKRDTLNQPPLGIDPILVYHEALGQSLLLVSDSLNEGPNEVWLWTGADWTNLSSQVFQSGGPTEQYMPGVAYDRASMQILLYGGRQQNHWGTIMDELWTLGTFTSTDGTVSIGNWRKQENPEQPSLVKNNASHRVRMAYDAAAEHLIIHSNDFEADTNIFTYTLSGLQANPPILPADGIAVTALSYTVVNSDLEPIIGQSMILQGNGSVSGKLPFQSAISDELGNVSFEVSHLVAEKVVYTITEAGSGLPLGAGVVQFIDPVPDATRSSLTLSTQTIDSDGIDTALATVTVRSRNGLALPGYRVYLTAPHSTSATIMPQSEGADLTQVDGTATFLISNTDLGRLDIEAAVSMEDAADLVIGGASLDVVLPNPMSIVTASLLDGRLGAAYHETLNAAGGIAPYVWSLIDGDLPEGLTLDAHTGVISGIIPASAVRGSDTYIFTIQVEDAASDKQIVSQQLSIQVAPEDLIFDISEYIDGELKPGLEVNNFYSVGDRLAIPLQARGGAAPYTWLVTQGALPQGVILDGETGIIHGVPLSAGDYVFDISVIDDAGSVQSATLSIRVAARPLDYVHSGTSDDPDGIALASSGDVTATGYGQGTVTTAIFDNNPAGDTSSVFRSADRYFDVKAEPGHRFDQLRFIVENMLPAQHTIYWWQPEDQAWKQVSNQIYHAETRSTTVTIDTYSSPNLQQMYGTEFGVGSPLLPAPIITDVSLAEGTGSGGTEVEVRGAHFTQDSFIMFDDNPLQTEYVSESLLRAFLIPGSGTVEVRVASPYGLSAETAESRYTYTGSAPTLRLTLHAKLAGSDLSDPDIAIVQPGQLITLIGSVYDEHNEPLSGQRLLLTTSQGTIATEVVSNETGVYETTLRIPVALYASQVTIRVIVDGDATATTQRIIYIHPAALEISNELQLPGALAGGEPYRIQFAASGGMLPYEWSVVSGELPAHWQLSEDGVLTGLPVMPGDYSFMVQVAGSGAGGGMPARKLFQLTIHLAPPIVSERTIPNGRVGSPYREVLAAADGEGHYSWEVAEGVWPIGLTLTSEGIIEGVPEEDGSFLLKLIVKNELALETELVTIRFSIEPEPEPDPESGSEFPPTSDAGSRDDDHRKVIPAGGTGQYKYDDELTVFIPAGSTDQSLWITIDKWLDDHSLVGDTETLLSPIFEVLKNMTHNFLTPITLTFRWDTEKLGLHEIPAVFYYDEQALEWVHIGGIVEDDRIVVKVDHFTKFAVFAIPQTPFTDIQGHWAETDIILAADEGIISGYPDGSFRPEQLVSRAEFAVMLARVLKLEGELAPLGFMDHADIPTWAITQVQLMVQAGIINGYDDHTFRPDNIINRAEMAMMVARALKLNWNASSSTSFRDDQDIPAWAKGAVQAVSELAIVQGRGNRQFFPMDAAKRAEATVILLRMVELIND